MKTKITFAILMAMVAGQSLAQALTATEIMEKSIAASGGRAAYEKQKSMIIKSDISVAEMGIKGESVAYQKGVKNLSSMTLTNVGDFIQAYDGKIAWSNDPINGLRKLPDDERDAFVHTSPASLLIYKTAFKTVELVGTEVVDSRKCYVIKLSPAKGEPVTQYIDQETFMVSRMMMKMKSGGQVTLLDITMSDYRPVEGVMVPFNQKINAQMMVIIVKVTSVKVNVAIDDSKFAYPTKKPAK